MYGARRSQMGSIAAGLEQQRDGGTFDMCLWVGTEEVDS